MESQITGKTLIRSFLICLLSLVLVISFLPVTALASEDDNANGGSVDQTGDADIVSSEITDEGLVVEYSLDDLGITGEEEAATEEDVMKVLAAAELVPLADTEGTVDCGNGWVLGYELTDEGIAISEVVSVGNGDLVIPETVDGSPVVAIGNRAFENCSVGFALTLPQSITSLGLYAFSGAGVTSINIPAGVTRITYSCFIRCLGLSDVTFEGASMRYLSQYSFAMCTSLKSIEIPLLTDTPTREDQTEDDLNGAAVSFNFAVGANCFNGCSNLSLIIFDGPIVSNPVSYLSDPSCVTGCADDLSIVCKCAAISIPSGTGGAGVVTAGNVYYTFDFYASAEGADNQSYDDPDYLSSVTLKAVTRELTSTGNQRSTYAIQIFPFLYGTTDYSDLIYEGNVPDLPEGKVWGVVNTSLNASSYMTSCYRVAAVDPEDITYGWVSSPSIDALNAQGSSTSGTGGGFNDNDEDYAQFYMAPDGSIPELDEISVHDSMNRVIDPNVYTLAYEKASYEYSEGNNGRIQTTTIWNDIDLADITEPGEYRVHGVGVGEYSESETATAAFQVVRQSPSVKTYYDSSSTSEYLAAVAYDSTANLTETPAFDVIVPSSDWQNQLLGAGFAGAGNGLLLTDCKSDYSANMTKAAISSGADSYIMMGTEEAVPQSINTHDEVYLADFVDEKLTRNHTRYGSGTTTAQELATTAIGRFRAANWGAEWGSTAVVASATDELATVAATQYIYHNAARTFFLKDDGTIADDDLTLLAASDITDIVLVGDSTCVSDDVANGIASATGKTPTRILEDSNACSASIDLAQQLVDAGNNSWSTVVVADASKSANVSNAAVYAEQTGGVMLTCRTTADLMQIEALFEQLILTTDDLGVVSDLRLVGKFNYVDDAGTYLSSAWETSYADLNGTGSITLNTDDTFESSGYLYQVTGATTARLIGFTGSASYTNLPKQVTFAGVTYTVESISAFNDVNNPNDYYYDSIYTMVSLGVITGYNASTFGVGDSMTRAQLATILWRVSEPEAYAAYNEKTAKNTTNMPDNPDGMYYTGAVNWASENGIVTGNQHEDGSYTFNPDDPVTFEQMITMVARLVIGADKASSYNAVILDVSTYTDGSSVSDWARGAMSWSIAEGLVTGNNNGNGTYTIAPLESVARERATTVLARAIGMGDMSTF